MSRRSRLRRHQSKHTAGRVVIGGVAALLALTVLLAGGGTAVAIGLAASWLTDLPSVSDPSAFAVAQTTKIYSADGKLLANLFLENRQVVPLANISPFLQHAVVSVEDERFYKHNGFDTVGIVRAAFTNLAAGGVEEGASTITQQIVRNTVLSAERTEISYKRKVREAYLAYELEKVMSKDEILSMYLNTVYYGEGAYGAESAALTYFNKHAKDLTVAEAALLAGLPQQPSRLSPYENLEGAVARRQWVLKKMQENGYIDEAQYEEAKVEEVKLERAPNMNEEGVYAAPYFVAYVKKVLQDEFGTSLVFKGGLKVYTSLDTKMQTLAEKSVRNVLNLKTDPDAALVAIDPLTGNIKALVGGRDWKTNKFNFATQARRQPGSSFKMFTLVTALESGMPPRRMLDSSSPATIQTGGKPWVVSNAEGGGGKGYITLQAATVGSVNTAYARLAKELSPEKIVKTAKRMGITTHLEPYLSITLGSQEVTPLEMASAYGTLANQGKHFPPTAVTKVEDAGGKTIFEANPEGSQAISKEVAYAAVSIMKGVITGGTATRANIGRPAAGKTGTTQDYRDAWFVGFTPQLVCSVWMGYTPERPMRNVHGRKVFGGTWPAQIWHDFMGAALKNEPKLNFKSAASPKYTWKSEWDIPITQIPKVVGIAEAGAIAALEKAKFVPEITYAYSPTVLKGRVISQTPAAGSKAKPGDTVTLVISKGPDPNAPPPPPPPPPDTTSTPPATSTP
ncbi:MAG: penicillin-binding protein [Actinobacteria bacterium HGW-Actinobacteria-1]|nr:MAG: penicillin-binding protein [Actinobacteria bacterium HGW-Actinobacteria-1]